MYGIFGREEIQKSINEFSQKVLNFKVGDKVKYKHYSSIKGTVTKIDYSSPYGVSGVLINDSLIANPDEIELDVELFIDNEPFQPVPANTKYKCNCTMRELMMKGCTRHE